MYLLVPAHLGCLGQSPESCKMVVCVIDSDSPFTYRMTTCMYYLYAAHLSTSSCFPARNLGIRVGEHKREVGSKDTSRFTWISKKATDEQQNKSITDRVTRENHVIDWNGVKVIGHQTDHRTRWIKEAIAVRKHKEWAMNRDTGSYFLSSSYDKLLLRDSISPKWHFMKKSRHISEVDVSGHWNVNLNYKG